MGLFGKMLDSLAEKLEAASTPKQYSREWFANRSLDELDEEREKTRVEYCSSGRDFAKATELENLLHTFDNVIRERRYGNEEPKGDLPHSEHGWYLPEDD